MTGKVIIKVTNLKKYFELKKGFLEFFGGPVYVKAVDDVNFDLREGEILGLVGESGCGKTTAGRLLTRLEDPTDGFVFFQGRDIARLEGEDLKIFRRNIQMVFQDPYESLNPRTTVLQTIMEPLINHNIGDSFEARVLMVIKALEDAGLAPAKEYLGRFPHELSGGQRQRVSVARALVINPKIIVADEPVSMLDVSIRAGVLNLMLDLRDKYHIPYLFITHDIAVARYVSDRLAVMYLGRVVELAETDEVIFKSKHPYTQALLSAVPVPDPERKHGRISIKGEIPSAANVPLGCRFRPRCPKSFKNCGWEGADLADHLVAEEKIDSPGHPMSTHIERLDPKGFSLIIRVKQGGSANVIKKFVESKVNALKDTRPLFQAVWAVEKWTGNKELVVKCKSVKVDAKSIAKELLDVFTMAVDYRAPEHPMHGVILDAQTDGASVVIKVGAESGTIVRFMRDLVKRYRMGDYPEFKSVEEPAEDPKSKSVTLRCRPGTMSTARVAREVVDIIEKDFAFNKDSPFSGQLAPIEVKGGNITIKTLGGPETYSRFAEELRKHFKIKEASGSAVAKGIAAISSRDVKGAREFVEAKLLKVAEPPLLDVGGGHMVACYLYKPVAK